MLGSNVVRPLERLGDYELGSELGAGGMGQVFRAVHVRTGAPAAVKLVRDPLSESLIRRFRREVSGLQRVRDRHVVAYVAHDLEHEPPYLVTELVTGQPLSAVLRKRGLDSGPVLSAHRIRQVATGLARGLAAAHRVGVVHRDVKPDNVILDGEGEAVLIDFGLTRIPQGDSGSLTTSGAVMGTVAYMSPEQASADEVGAPSDVYQWGLVVYELLMGHRPYDDQDPMAAVLLRARDGVPAITVKDPESAGLARLAELALRADPGRRPADASKLVSKLDELASGADSAVTLAEVVSAPVAPALPDRVGPYVVTRVIGQGGMGAVFEGRNPHSGERVAIKRILASRFPSAAIVARFRREAEVLARVLSPRVVRLLDSGEDAAGHYLIMEYIEGESLAALLERDGPRSPAEALEVLEAITEGIADLHRAGVQHRDIKPANVIQTARAGPRVVDLGLAMDPSLTQLTREGQRMGTMAYAAPEMLRDGTSSPASDVYQLGGLLYELITGRRDFRIPGADAGLRGALGRDTSARGPSGVRRVDQVVELFRAAVALDPSHRPADGAALLSALRPVRKAWLAAPAASTAPRSGPVSIAPAAPPAVPGAVRRGLGIFRQLIGGVIVLALVALAILCAMLIPALTPRPGTTGSALPGSSIDRADDIRGA
jgi:serine/threonine protein kinase